MRAVSSSSHPPLTRPAHAGDVGGGRSWEAREAEELVPGYAAVRLLGGGPRYEAYLAWSERLHALVVVKLPRPAFAADPGARRSLAAEAEALRALSHPVLPRLFAADADAAPPYLVLELLDGPRLSTAIRRYRLAVEQVVPLGLQLASALHYLAREGWVHLDVKPKNVILGAPPRLIDLSVATRVEAARRLARPVGTDAYMAPEQCDPARLPELSPAADVWGLGVTLYEALEGRKPFSEPRPEAGDLAVRYPQLRERPRPLARDVPAPLAEAVHDCLARDPAARPAPAELSARLQPVEALLPRPRLGRFRPRDRAGA